MLLGCVQILPDSLLKKGLCDVMAHFHPEIESKDT